MSDPDELVERLFNATLSSLELLSVYLGWRLGLYRTIAEGGPVRPADLGIDERYATEWLEQQAAAGFLAVDDPNADPGDRRYSMPEGYADVFVDPESMRYVAPFAPMVVGIANALDDVAAAYPTGAGVPYTRYGADFRDGQGAINRPTYHHEMGAWIAAMPDIEQRLRQPDARVVDLGCGQGWSTIALARAFPDIEVVGIDSDQASIDDAVANATDADVAVRFVTADTVDSGADLVCIFEALHDMARPVDVLRTARGHLAPGGALLVVDERVGDAFTAPADEIERVNFAWSVLHCLPASRAESPSAALGTVLRTPTVERLGAEAGFSSVAVLDVENDFFKLYRMN